jgi:hypothetical protein
MPGADELSAALAKTLLPDAAQLPDGRASTITTQCSAAPGGKPVMPTWRSCRLPQTFVHNLEQLQSTLFNNTL